MWSSKGILRNKLCFKTRKKKIERAKKKSTLCVVLIYSPRILSYYDSMRLLTLGHKNWRLLLFLYAQFVRCRWWSTPMLGILTLDRSIYVQMLFRFFIFFLSFFLSHIMIEWQLAAQVQETSQTFVDTNLHKMRNLQSIEYRQIWTN